MNYFNTVYNSLFKSTPKINNLDIILESNGEYTAPPSNNYTPINDKLQISILKSNSNISPFNPTLPTSTTSTSIPTSNYNPPSNNLSTPNKSKEESPFSKFKIWGQKS